MNIFWQWVNESKNDEWLKKTNSIRPVLTIDDIDGNYSQSYKSLKLKKGKVNFTIPFSIGY